MLPAEPSAFLQSLFWLLSVSEMLQCVGDGDILAWIWSLPTATWMELLGKGVDDKKVP